MSKKATKKVEEKPSESEEQPTEETEQVTQVTEELPDETPSTEKAVEEKKPLEPVVISDMPTKKRVAPVNFAENDEKVFEWYSGRSVGDRCTRQEAADELELSVDEFNNSIGRLQKNLLGETLHHLTD